MNPCIMNIAITGGSGHIGVNLCRLLGKQGHKVRALLHHNFTSLKEMPIETIHGDILEPSSLRSLVRDADVVFHLAAVISIEGKKGRDLFRHNIEGTQNIIRAVRRFSSARLIHFSSIHTLLSNPNKNIMDENCPLAINDWMPYSRSKACAEAEVLKAVRSGLDAVILNPTAVIGPADPGPSLMGQALILMARSKLPVLVSGGYDWVDVRDVAQAAVSAMTKGRSGERYILCGHWADLSSLAHLVTGFSGARKKHWICPYWLARAGLPFLNFYSTIRKKSPLYTRDSLKTLRQGHPRISSVKAHMELDYIPRPLETTIKDTLAWFRDNSFLSC